MFSVINVTKKPLREPFYCDKKMLSSSVVCLSLTILTTFETKKGIIKILVYSSVINITVKPVLSGPVLSGHPLLSGHLSKSWKSLPLFTVNLTSIKRSPLLSRIWSPLLRSQSADFIVFTCIKRLLCLQKINSGSQVQQS